MFGIQFQEDEEENLQVDFESVLVKVFRDSPLFGAGVDVLAVGGVLHQRHVVVGGQGEVGHAAHQASNILPVRVEGDLLHATFSETREEIMRKWLVLSTVARWVLGEGPTLTDIQESVHVELSHLSWRPPCFRPVVVHCQLPRLTVPAEAGDRRHLSLTVLGRISTLQSYSNVPHSFDSVPLAVSKGPVDSDVSRAAAKVIAGSMRKQTQRAQSVEQAALSSQVHGYDVINATYVNKSQDISSRTDIISCQL